MITLSSNFITAETISGCCGSVYFRKSSHHNHVDPEYRLNKGVTLFNVSKIPDLESDSDFDFFLLDFGDVKLLYKGAMTPYGEERDDEDEPW